MVSPLGLSLLPAPCPQNTNTIRWFQQKAGEGPRFVHCDGCSNRGEGIPNRFTATRSGTTGTLTISNVQVGDEAVYYCVEDTSQTPARSSPSAEKSLKAQPEGMMGTGVWMRRVQGKPPDPWSQPSVA
ncbi:hypothetical protein L345_18117, partial [Ophiophagus hannah]